MTTRHYGDWLKAYLKYAEATEAPQHMHFWSGVSAVAGALRRRVWIDQAYFKWYPNFYIVLVAPPGIVSKSTTVGIAMDLLRKVPGIHFGPDVVTWQSLVERFASITEAFEYQSDFHPMSAMTLESSEFGNLLDPQDKEMIDLMVALWDGKQGGFEKSTKNKELAWLFAISRLPDPPKRMDKEYAITGDVKMDIERISDIKKELGRRLKMSI